MSNNVHHTNDSEAEAAALQAELEQVTQRMAELREQAARAPGAGASANGGTAEKLAKLFWKFIKDRGLMGPLQTLQERLLSAESIEDACDLIESYLGFPFATLLTSAAIATLPVSHPLSTAPTLTMARPTPCKRTRFERVLSDEVTSVESESEGTEFVPETSPEPVSPTRRTTRSTAPVTSPSASRESELGGSTYTPSEDDEAEETEEEEISGMETEEASSHGETESGDITQGEEGAWGADDALFPSSIRQAFQNRVVEGTVNAAGFDQMERDEPATARRGQGLPHMEWIITTPATQLVDEALAADNQSIRESMANGGKKERGRQRRQEEADSPQDSEAELSSSCTTAGTLETNYALDARILRCSRE
ncbi:uncharacterized protein EV422DRAFT_567830 [Fimicolochytrium jonesii]|uniref:uncharacterized protein n=1 Tax=Fimicolochytrium jonesii TaxID=1396493 RepID=UPI0022FE9CAC|nr:uncharacterized protein EV422DRAFT_567830 [Fimicolochytrium jonesii]KAI8820401.1 hypothetical protein EV422DRAFT_567830 [Fimicolochytrium jonesii]